MSPRMTPALWYCGLANEDAGVIAAAASPPPEDYEVGTAPARTEEDRAKETWGDGGLLTGSDCSGLHRRPERLQRCGYAF